MLFPYFSIKVRTFLNAVVIVSYYSNQYFFCIFIYVKKLFAKLEFIKDQMKYIIIRTWTAKQVFC